jgi:transcriptional regulator with XRE-family HTH domain
MKDDAKIEEKIHQLTSDVIEKIVQKRKEKGYSLDNMAEELNISPAAYLKIERRETKLTFERFLRIQMLLDISLQELFDIKVETTYHQNLSAQSVNYQAGVQNLHQDNKKLTENFIKSLQEEIVFLRRIIEEKHG